MNGFLPDTFNLACRAGRVLSILLIEIKNIKTLRKVLGDQSNTFLAAQAQELRNKLNTGDMIFRYNDNTFLILLHDILSDEATEIGWDLVATSRALTTKSKKGLLFAEPGLGVATHGSDLDFKNTDEWIDEANTALHAP
jgi:GGDEF domain-containing protein